MASYRQLPLRGLLSVQPRQSLARQPYLAPTLLTREYHQSLMLSQAFKDDQERADLKPRSYDYTMSGSDYDASDHHANASFNPKITTPEEAKELCQKDCADGGYEASPLEFSPANQSLSNTHEEGSGSNEHKHKLKSGERSAKKSGTTLLRQSVPDQYRIG